MSGCRVEVLIQCDAGSYEMQSGTGDLATEEPGCQSSHCELLHQPILATLNVVGPPPPPNPLLTCLRSLTIAQHTALACFCGRSLLCDPNQRIAVSARCVLLWVQSVLAWLITHHFVASMQHDSSGRMLKPGFTAFPDYC